ncbi:MAG: antitoxin [Dermatophilaceae bacterium]|nr:antitoxin [Intrasporangiaceae bacterium]
MNVNEQLKAKIDEIDLDTKLTQLTETASVFLATAKEHGGSLVHDNRAKLDELIEKATAAIDEKTEGKYHAKVEKARASFANGLDLLEDTRGEDAPGFDETEMHAGEETGQGEGVDLLDSTVRPESAWQTTDSAPSADTLAESASEPHDPQAWADETDKTS